MFCFLEQPHRVQIAVAITPNCATEPSFFSTTWEPRDVRPSGTVNGVGVQSALQATGWNQNARRQPPWVNGPFLPLTPLPVINPTQTSCMVASASYSVHFSLPFLMTPLPSHPDFAMTHPVGQRLLQVCSQQFTPPLSVPPKNHALVVLLLMELHRLLPREEQTCFQGSFTSKIGLIPC